MKNVGNKNNALKNSVKKFNLLDLVIIILLAAIILGAFFRTDIIRLISGEETVTMEITFETEPVSTLYYGYFAEGDKWYVSDTDVCLGTVSALSKVLAPVMVQMDDGSYEEDVELERSVISGTITVDGYLRDGVFCLDDGTIISAGDTISAEGKLVTCKITVLSVKEAKNDEISAAEQSASADVSK